MSQQWYYSKGGQRQGPVGSEQLKTLAATGQIQASDLVWKEGMGQWVEARKVKGLVPPAQATGSKEPPPLPFAGPSPTETTPPPSPSDPASPAPKQKIARSPEYVAFGYDLNPFLNRPATKVVAKVVMAGFVLCAMGFAILHIGTAILEGTGVLHTGKQYGPTTQAPASSMGEAGRQTYNSQEHADRALVGKTTEEVLAMLGKPDFIYGGGSYTVTNSLRSTGVVLDKTRVEYDDSWGYEAAVKHEATGMLQTMVVCFIAKKVVGVTVH